MLDQSLGNPVNRWFAKKKEVVSVPYPIMVHMYNKHMGGVDLADMLMALYRINVKKRKWYRHLVYYSIGVAVTNGWLLYRRDCEAVGIPKKKQLKLMDFQHQIAESLIKEGKSEERRGAGRPSLELQVNKKSQTLATVPILCLSILKDQISHFGIPPRTEGCCHYCKGEVFW